jgi:hypothetical protein
VEVVITYFTLISWHLPGGMKENHEKFVMIELSRHRFVPGTSRILTTQLISLHI